MKIPIAKLKALLLFLGTYTDPRFLGKVKLMKLLYFVDFEHVRRYGSPVTYDRYVKLEHGPIPSTIKNLVDSVEDDSQNSKLRDTIAVQEGIGGLKKIVPSRKFEERDKGHFSKSELKIMYEIASRFSGATMKEIEDASHKEAPWSTTEFLDYIPYSLAVEDEEEKKAIDLAMKLIDD